MALEAAEEWESAGPGDTSGRETGSGDSRSAGSETIATGKRIANNVLEFKRGIIIPYEKRGIH
jgi:hypothetical protein